MSDLTHITDELSEQDATIMRLEGEKAELIEALVKSRSALHHIAHWYHLADGAEKRLQIALESAQAILAKHQPKQ